MKIEKKTETTIISEFQIDFKISGLKEKYMRATELKATSCKDENGVDLMAEGKIIIDERYAAGGFFTSTELGWEFYDYDFYKLPNVFGARFSTFATPSIGSKYVDLTTTFAVTIRKPGRNREVTVKKVNIADGGSINVEGKPVTFTSGGTMTQDEQNFQVFNLKSELAIEDITIMGVKLPEGYGTMQKEIILPEGKTTCDLKFRITDTEIVEIPINMRIYIGS